MGVDCSKRVQEVDGKQRKNFRGYECNQVMQRAARFDLYQTSLEWENEELEITIMWGKGKICPTKHIMMCKT